MKEAIFILALLLACQSFQFGSRSKPVQSGPPPNNYPIRAVYVDRSDYWYGDKIAEALAVPGIAPPHQYNYVLLAFWMCSSGPTDMAGLWANAYTNFGPQSQFGKSTDEIQKTLKKKYNDAGVKIMVSAFGATEFPTSAGADPTVCAQKLGKFVKDNNFDGADLDWEDNDAMKRGTGEAWLITFTKVLRKELPNHIITHAPQAPYFKNEYYTHGAYKTIHDQVGDLIDFYMVQFYNQVDSKYDTYEELFVKASGSEFNGTSVKEIAARGIPLRKIVIGKPVKQSDASNTGWISMDDFATFNQQGYKKLGWYAGVMFWQYPSDKDGSAVKTVSDFLIKQCKKSGECV